MAAEQNRVHLTVSGTVQGVFYRASTLEIAQGLRLTGWVRNLDDGRVEITAEGSRYALEELIRWCQQGPPEADVSDVGVSWNDASREFQSFRVVG